MHWKYEWVTELPMDVYEILLEELNKQQQTETT
jgi:hypothetical protein